MEEGGRTWQGVTSDRWACLCGGRCGWEGGCCRKNASFTLVKAPACPFSPWRRGEGAAAAADEGRFFASPVAPMKRRLRTPASAIAPNLPRPLIRCCRTTFSPLARGEGKAGAVARTPGCTLVKAPACPFSPWRRGEGAAAAADEGRFRALSATADEVARAHCCNVDRAPPPTAPHPVLPHHLLPAARGEGTGMRFLEIATSHSCDNASYPFSPWRRGEGAAAAADEGRFSASTGSRG